MVKKSIYPGRPLHLRDYRLPQETDGSWAELLRKYGSVGVDQYLADPQNLRQPPDGEMEISLCANPFLWGPVVVGHLHQVGTAPRKTFYQEETLWQAIS